MPDPSHTDPAPSAGDHDKQPHPASDRGLPPADAAEGAALPPADPVAAADLPAAERGGPAAD